MSTEVFLTALNVFQACFIAWLTYRQERVRRDLRVYNGRIEHKLETVQEAVTRRLREPRA